MSGLFPSHLSPSLPMPLSAAAPRQHLHTRRTEFHGFLREDGLWDIEGTLTDAKTYAYQSSERGDVPAGTPVHGIKVRMTLDEQMRIVAIEAAMDHTPYGECVQAGPPVQGLVGRSVGRGWRKTINEVLGGVQGCTHMRELLFNMATAAYQTMWPWRETERRRLGQDRAQPLEPPPHIGQCMTWAVDSPVTARIEPMFYRPRQPVSETASS